MKTPLPRPPKGGPTTSGPIAAAALAALLSTGTVNNAGALLAQASVLPLGTVQPSYTSAAFSTATPAFGDAASVFPTLALSDATVDVSTIEARAKELAAQEQEMARLTVFSWEAGLSNTQPSATFQCGPKPRHFYLHQY